MLKLREIGGAGDDHHVVLLSDTGNAAEPYRVIWRESRDGSSNVQPFTDKSLAERAYARHCVSIRGDAYPPRRGLTYRDARDRDEQASQRLAAIYRDLQSVAAKTPADY